MKNKPSSLLESDAPDSLCNSKRRSQIKFSSSSLNKSEKGKQKVKTAKLLETPYVCPDGVSSSSCLSSPAVLGDDAAELAKESASRTKMEQKIPKRARLSISSLVRSFTQSSKSKSLSSHSTGGDDDVFEDYFSPANHHQKSQRPSLPNLCVEGGIPIPFELDPSPKKKKPRRSESTTSETNSTKKRKLGDIQSDKNNSQQSDANKPQSLDVDGLNANVTLVAKRRRQSTLPFTRTSTTNSDAVKQRRASTSSSTLLIKASTESELQKKSDVSVVSQLVESE